MQKCFCDSECKILSDHLCLQSSLFDHMCDDLETEHPKRPPKPESVRRYNEREKERRRTRQKLGLDKKAKRHPSVIHDDELHLGIRLRL